MSTPVDMQPLFWWLVVFPVVWIALALAVGLLVGQMATLGHIDPSDDPWGDVDVDWWQDLDDAPCPACGDPTDLTGQCGCGLNPRRRLERDYGAWWG